MNKIVRIFLLGVMLITMVWSNILWENKSVSANDYHYSDPSIFLNKLSGAYYDEKGNIVLYIDNKGINGYKLVEVFDLAGGSSNGIGTFKILENDHYKNLRIEWRTSTKTKYLIVNDGLTLQNTKKVEYFESVGGVYLGMTDKEVLNAYGAPTSVEDEKPGKFKTWFYDNDGWTIRFYNGRVDQITILKNGTRRLDRSGYNCDNSLDEFAAFYNIENIARGVPRSIGGGEYLWIYKDVENRAAGDGINVDHIVLTVCWA